MQEGQSTNCNHVVDLHLHSEPPLRSCLAGISCCDGYQVYKYKYEQIVLSIEDKIKYWISHLHIFCMHD